MMSIIHRMFAVSEQQGMALAEENYDRLLERVEADEMDLVSLENRIHDEFERIEGDVKNISKEVDRAVE